MRWNERIDTGSDICKFAVLLHRPGKIFSMSLNHSDVEFESLRLMKKELSRFTHGGADRSPASEHVGEMTVPAKSPAQLYFNKHRIIERIEDLVNQLAEKMPEDPDSFVAHYFSSSGGTKSACQSVSKENIVQLSVQSFCIINCDSISNASKSQSREIEVRLPANEVDDKFSSYLSNLATSIRRSTT